MVPPLPKIKKSDEDQEIYNENEKQIKSFEIVNSVRKENIFLLDKIDSSFNLIYSIQQRVLEKLKEKKKEERISKFEETEKAEIGTSKLSKFSFIKNIIKKHPILAALSAGFMGVIIIEYLKSYISSDEQELKTKEVTKKGLEGAKTGGAFAGALAAESAIPEGKVKSETVPPPIPKNKSPIAIEKPTISGTVSSYPPSTGIKIPPMEIYSYLESKNLDDSHIKGILANIKYESNFSPNSEGKEKDGTISVGLFQWRASRKENMIKKIPKWKTDWKAQIDYAINEDAGPVYLKKHFNNAKDASIFWTENWERPENKETVAKFRANSVNEFIKKSTKIELQNKSIKLSSLSKENATLEEKQASISSIIIADNSNKQINNIVVSG